MADLTDPELRAIADRVRAWTRQAVADTRRAIAEVRAERRKRATRRSRPLPLTPKPLIGHKK